jgi:hypothetical protein
MTKFHCGSSYWILLLFTLLLVVGCGVVDVFDVSSLQQLELAQWLSSPLLTEQIRKTLTRANVPFAEQVSVDGYQADFVIQTADGHTHILETKPWKPTGPDITRAKKLASELKKLSVNGSYIVLPTIDHERPEQGIVSVHGLAALLKAQAGGQPLVPPMPVIPAEKEQRIVFAAMPFAAKYDDVFFVAIRGAAKASRSTAKRVDKEDYTGDVVERIRQRISHASAVVVDLSESRPNVLYEMGFAQASGKPVIPICSTSVDDIPFDVRNLNIILYEQGQTNALRPKLSRRLRAAFGGDSA